MHYLPSDATLDQLPRATLVARIAWFAKRSYNRYRGAACGGTHRLMGLSYAVRKREQRGEPITGIYLEAKKYIDQYHKYTV